MLVRDGPSPTSAVAEAVGVSKMTAHRHLNQLLDAGAVSRAFAVQTAVWSVAEESR